MTFYLDLDGVLADFSTFAGDALGLSKPEVDATYEMKTDGVHNIFDDSATWEKLSQIDDLFFKLAPLPDAFELWDFCAPHRPTIITGIPRSIPGAITQKRRWIDKYLDPTVMMIGCKSKDKATYCRPGDILVDDWERYKHKWVMAGGTWITHRSAKETIPQLKAVFPK